MPDPRPVRRPDPSPARSAPPRNRARPIAAGGRFRPLLPVVAGLLAGSAMAWTPVVRLGSAVVPVPADRAVLADVLGDGVGPFGGRQREAMADALRTSFLALDRMAVQLQETVIADASHDGLDLLADLRVAEIDPLLAAGFEPWRLREAILDAELALVKATEAAPSPATLRTVRAAVADARLRARQAAVLVGRFSTGAGLTTGEDGRKVARGAPDAPLRLVEQVLAALDASLERRGEALEAAATEIFRAEVRSILRATAAGSAADGSIAPG